MTERNRHNSITLTWNWLEMQIATSFNTIIICSGRHSSFKWQANNIARTILWQQWFFLRRMSWSKSQQIIIIYYLRLDYSVRWFYDYYLLFVFIFTNWDVKILIVALNYEDVQWSNDIFICRWVSLDLTLVLDMNIYKKSLLFWRKESIWFFVFAENLTFDLFHRR